MDLVKCDGAGLYYRGTCWLVGVTPPENLVKYIAEWLLSSHGDSTGLSTDSLADTGYPGAALLGDAVYGMATARITSKDFLFWFRSHTAKEVKWGGAKHHPEDKEDGGRMHPRSSFIAFLEVVKSKSLPWEVSEINAIHSLQLIMRDSFRDIDHSDSRDTIIFQQGDTEMKGVDELSSEACEMVRLIETATSPIFGVDSSGLINGWNAKIVELTGLQASEAMGKSFVNDVVHQDSLGTVEHLLCRALQGIGDLLVQKAQLLGGVSDQVAQLQTDLTRMQCLLKDADKRQDEDEAVRYWVSEIRELAYKAEALLETFALKLILKKEKGFVKTIKRYASNLMCTTDINTLAVEINSIKDKINSLATNLQPYSKDDPEGSTRLRTRKPQLAKSYSHLDVENAVGLVGDTELLLHQLVEYCPKKRQVISICGMGGLGKTTLATKLYSHPTVRGHFKAFAWTCVSQQFEVRQVLKELLVKLSQSLKCDPKMNFANMNDGAIAKKLYNMQKEISCLVILDDVWNLEDWNVLKHAFPIGHIFGRVVITTRNKALAVHVDPHVFIHEPQTLSDGEGWELLKQNLFSPTDNQGFGDKEKIGQEMVRTCSGLPLAIRVLGGLLAKKHSLSEWNSVNENVKMHLKRGQERSQINYVLAPSYYDLSYRLKSCFLYFSHFPEDYSIPCKKLYRLWIAEGIVTYMPHEVIGEETLEDRAEMHLQELIDKSMVQVCEFGSTGRVKSCRLHDLMRELCMLKANQDNFFDVLHSHQKNETNDSRLAHRLAIYVQNEETIDINMYTDAFYLRSLLIINKEGIYKEDIVSFGDFRLLKVLSLRRCLIPKESSKQIGKLIFLKYLAFEKCVIESVPASIGNISHLQTLIVQNQVGYKTKIPNVIIKLEKLRHLRLIGVTKYDQDQMSLIQLGKLNDIQTLAIDNLNLFDIKDISEFVKLKKLVVSLSYGGYMIEQLQGILLNHLVTLCIKFDIPESEIEVRNMFARCNRVQKLKLDGSIEKLPEYHYFPPCLGRLSLVMSTLKEDPMTILEKLPELTTLILDCTFEGTKMVCSSSGFPRLKSLFVHHLNGLIEWQVDEGAMGNLRKLQIMACGGLKMVPDGMKYITSLCNIVIIRMPVEFTNRIIRDEKGVEGDDYYKVSHVPCVTIL